jgi:hypothetical protein
MRLLDSTKKKLSDIEPCTIRTVAVAAGSSARAVTNNRTGEEAAYYFKDISRRR